MSQSNVQKIYQALILVVLISLSIARPNGNVDNQESQSSTTMDNQVGLTDFERSLPYRAMPPMSQYFNFDEPSLLDKYQLQQYRSFIPNVPIFRGGGGGGSASLPIWDPYRQLVSKRQTRYRQCYFNPISCFRK